MLSIQNRLFGGMQRNDHPPRHRITHCKCIGTLTTASTSVIMTPMHSALVALSTESLPQEEPRQMDYRDIVLLAVDPKQGMKAVRAISPRPTKYILARAAQKLQKMGHAELSRDMSGMATENNRRGCLRRPPMVGETRPYIVQQSKKTDGVLGAPGIWLPLRVIGVQVKGQVVDVTFKSEVVEIRFTRKPESRYHSEETVP